MSLDPSKRYENMCFCVGLLIEISVGGVRAPLGSPPSGIVVNPEKRPIGLL